jgi:hypothetical protein
MVSGAAVDDELAHPEAQAIKPNTETEATIAKARFMIRSPPAFAENQSTNFQPYPNGPSSTP